MRMNGFMTKNELRSVMRVRNRQLSPEERIAAAERIFAAVEMLPAFGRARCVACFCALPDEPPTEAVLRRWSAVRRIVVPRVEGDAMQFYDYRPSALTSGAFGIAEPVVEDCPVCPPEAIDLMLVPGMAFTREGARLGRGQKRSSTIVIWHSPSCRLSASGFVLLTSWSRRCRRSRTIVRSTRSVSDNRTAAAGCACGAKFTLFSRDKIYFSFSIVCVELYITDI